MASSFFLLYSECIFGHEWHQPPVLPVILSHVVTQRAALDSASSALIGLKLVVGVVSTWSSVDSPFSRLQKSCGMVCGVVDPA